MDNAFDSTEVLKEQEGNNFQHLVRFFHKLLKLWWVFAIFGTMGIVAGFFVIRYTTPVYLITSKLLVEDEYKGGGGVSPGDLLGDMGGLLNSKSNIDNEVEILKTRQLAEKVVRDLDLNISYFRSGKIKKNLIYPSPFKVKIIGSVDTIKPTFFDFDLIDDKTVKVTYQDSKTEEEISQNVSFGRPFIVKEIGAIRIDKNPEIYFKEKKYHFYITTVDQATTIFQKELVVAATNKMVSIIDVNLHYPLPEEGEVILKRFIKNYTDSKISDKNVVADSTIKFIDDRLTYVSRELGDIEQNIQTFKQSKQLTDIPEQSKLLVANTNFNEKELINLRTQVSIMEALEEYLRDETKSKSAVPSSIILQDVVFNKLSETYNTLLLDRERQLLTSTENNPYISNLDQRIASIRKTMLSNLSSTKNTIIVRIKELQKSQDMLTDRLHDIPANERAYLGLFRQQSLKQELYLFLLQKREEVALSKTANISNAKVIDYPKSDAKPYKPKGLIILALGFLAGLVIPFVGIYIQELLNNKVQSKEDITQIVPVPVLGEISKVENGELFVNNNPKSVLSEQFRALRSNLNFYYSSGKGMSLIITSNMQAEGKTFTAINLASIFAITGKKVLLIDLDLRVASLSDKLQMKNKPGFSNYIISEQTDYHNMIYKSDISDNLFVMPSGALPPNPAETLMMEKTEKLLSKIREEFDYVILDTPPIGLVADAQLLSKYVSITLFMVRQNHTFKSQLNNIRALSKGGSLGKIGIVFNDTKDFSGTTAVYGRYGSTDNGESSSIKKVFKKLTVS